MQHLLRVIPVVGILWDRKAFNPTPNPAEVEAVFDAPFEMFLKVPLVSFYQGGFIVAVFIYSEASLVEIYILHRMRIGDPRSLSGWGKSIWSTSLITKQEIVIMLYGV